jgi:hypothetical protein
MPPTRLRRVDLPLPDLPTTATNSPEPMSSETARRAGNLPAGVSYVFVTCRMEIMGVFILRREGLLAACRTAE